MYFGPTSCTAIWYRRHSGRSSLKPRRFISLTNSARGANENSPAPRPSRNDPSKASVPASRRISNFTADAVNCSPFAGRPVSSSSGRVWPMLQSPFHRSPFQSRGAGARTCRNAFPSRSSAVQVPWMSVGRWARTTPPGPTEPTGPATERTRKAAAKCRMPPLMDAGRRRLIAPGPGDRAPGVILDGDRLGFTDHSEVPPDAILDGLADVGVFLQELFDVLATLAQALAAVREPRAGLLDDALVDGQVEQVAGPRNALAVHHVELGLAEGRSHLVLDDLHAGAAADDHVAVLDAGDAADVHPHR